VEIFFIVDGSPQNFDPLRDLLAKFIVQFEFPDLIQRILIILQGLVVLSVVLISQSFTIQVRMAVSFEEDNYGDHKCEDDHADKEEEILRKRHVIAGLMFAIPVRYAIIPNAL
jgi:hypothetical protein